MPRHGLRFVQFPHPGSEHAPQTTVMPWNTADHRRKFLLHSGRYVDADDTIREGELVFWGEWEPPSDVVARWSAEGHLPRALHRPWWYTPPDDWSRQNTDPWVYGPQMLYSNCKQRKRISTRSTSTRPTSMQDLSVGSVICFGSTKGEEFCLDTLLVVAAAETWVPADVDDLDLDEAFVVCTGRSLAAAHEHATQPFILYRGATIDDPVAGMYSFVPARRADEPDFRFARPPVRLPGLINPRSRQSVRGINEHRTMDEVRNAWEAIRSLVLDAGLLLGVSLTTPPRRDDGATGGRRTATGAADMPAEVV